jgi:stage II sporulation protein AA (anti-sigma F factor antagonist)
MAAAHHRMYEQVLRGRPTPLDPHVWPGLDDSGLLQLTVATSDTGTIVSPRGDIDHLTAPTLAEALRIAGEVEGGDVTVDMSAVEFIDAGGIRCLLEAAKRVDPERRRIIVHAPSDAVSRVLELFRMDLVPNVAIVRGTNADTLPERRQNSFGFASRPGTPLSASGPVGRSSSP